MAIELSREQKDARDNILHWMKNRPLQKVEALAGYAGTGKTTLLAHMAKTVQEDPEFKKNFAFLTFTGKATSVLGQKMSALGVDMSRNVSRTIHSAIYRPLDTMGKKIEWQRTGWKKDEGTDWVFIVDEGSMLNDQILHDLSKSGYPILLVGDPGQLPPIDGATPKELLTTKNRLAEVHRQAWENPIIKMAHHARFQKEIEFKIHGPGVARLPQNSQEGHAAIQEFMKRMKEPCSQAILCATNNARVSLNNKIRALAGYYGLPKPGEKMVCLKNDRGLNVMNGQLFYVLKCEAGPEGLVDMTLYPEGEDESKKFRVMVFQKGLGRVDPRETYSMFQDEEMDLKDSCDGMPVGLFDFGYAMTVHKSQGSEWDAVILYNFRLDKWNNDHYARWLYTGITRAKDRLLIVG